MCVSRAADSDWAFGFWEFPWPPVTSPPDPLVCSKFGRVSQNVVARFPSGTLDPVKELEAPRSGFCEKLAVAVQTALQSEHAVAGGADLRPTRVESPAITAPDRTWSDAPLVAECWVGIDVAKAHLDVAIWPTQERLRVTRDEAGMAELIAWLRPQAPALIVLEATGGLETLIAGMLIEAQFPTAVINPRQARDFAKALGVLAKTDARSFSAGGNWSPC